MASLLLWFNKFINDNLGLNVVPTSYFLCALGKLLNINSFKPRFPTNEVRYLEKGSKFLPALFLARLFGDSDLLASGYEIIDLKSWERPQISDLTKTPKHH